MPRSICLGFEQYSSSLAKIRTDLVHSTRNINDAKDPHTFHLKDVMLGLTKANGEDEDDGSWYLKYFKEDVYILGFGLDLSEQDIWWLLDYRIRQRKYEKTNLFSLQSSAIALTIGVIMKTGSAPQLGRGHQKRMHFVYQQMRRGL